MEFGKVKRPAELSKLLGVDVRGFKHGVSNQALQHVLKNHGNVNIEKARGQLAVRKADLDLLPEIVARGNYRPAEAGRHTNPRFVIVAEIDGIGYHYTAEARSRKRRLDMVTLRKKKRGW